MAGKKYPGKFTLQFNSMDPAHRQVIALLEPMGRSKSQFISNAVLHYVHCSQTPDIPTPAPVDYNAIEVIVRRILAEQGEVRGQSQTEEKKEPAKKLRKSEDICYDEAVELLGEDSIAAITDTLSALRGK